MFSIVDRHEMFALFCAINEAKFNGCPQDRDVPASTLVAAVVKRLRDELVAADVSADGPSAIQKWDHWLRLTPERREWLAALHFARNEWSGIWSEWSAEQRLAAVEALLSPFVLSSEDMDVFLSSIGSE